MQHNKRLNEYLLKGINSLRTMPKVYHRICVRSRPAEMDRVSSPNLGIFTALCSDAFI